jgi:DNA-binding transcriptional LysR family regulator
LGEIETGLDVVNDFRDSPRGALRLNVPVIVAMKIEERIERDMIAAPIGPRAQRYVAAAAPAYLAAHGTPSHPRELVNHACIRHRFASGAVNDWEFERGSEMVRVKVDGPLVVSAIELELGAAIAGLGVIFTFEEFLRGALDRGELTEVLPDWSQNFSGPFLYYPSRNMPAPLQAFVDFIRKDGAAVAARGSSV